MVMKNGPAAGHFFYFSWTTSRSARPAHQRPALFCACRCPARHAIACCEAVRATCQRLPDHRQQSFQSRRYVRDRRRAGPKERAAAAPCRARQAIAASPLGIEWCLSGNPRLAIVRPCGRTNARPRQPLCRMDRRYRASVALFRPDRHGSRRRQVRLPRCGNRF